MVTVVFQDVCDMCICGFLRDRGASVLVPWRTLLSFLSEHLGVSFAHNHWTCKLLLVNLVCLFCCLFIVSLFVCLFVWTPNNSVLLCSSLMHCFKKMVQMGTQHLPTQTETTTTTQTLPEVKNDWIIDQSLALQKAGKNLLRA